MSEVLVLGAGGHAKVVISTLHAAGHTVVAVYDDDEARWGGEVLGVPVRGPLAAAGAAGVASGVIAIGCNATRKKIAGRVNLRWLTVVHPTAWIAPDAQLRAGTVVFAGAIIQPGGVIGQHVIINTAATIDHDCVIADWAHLAPGVHLAGGVRVGEGAYLGIGCMAIPARKIGAWTTVGAGAVVVRDLGDDVVAYGTPARAKRPAGSRPAETPRCAVIRADEEAAWLAVLAQMVQHDFYHLPQYHALAEDQGESEGRLLVFREKDCVIALPLLLRPLHAIPGLESAGAGRYDATSVYGYGGPLASHAELPAETVANFQRALQETLRAMGVVSVFSRLHPLFKQQRLLADLGACTELGRTVSIDLTVPLAAQRAAYRRNHRRDLKSLARAGVTCFRDEKLEHLDAFVSIYHEAMNRLDASEGYYFSREYFHGLFAGLGGAMQLFVCMLDGRPICGGAIAAVGDIAQAHLAGCRDEQVRLGPLKLLYDAAAVWARERGCRVLHIGGGVGSREDTLFNFKIGFSERTHRFTTWRWIVAPAVYRELCDARRRLDDRNGLEAVSADFFPAYRCPAAPRPAVPGAVAQP